MCKKILFVLIALCSFGLLSGCVSMRGPLITKQQKGFVMQPRQQIMARLNDLNTWQADGAFSFDSNQQVGIANFRVDVTPFAWRVHIASGLNLVQMTIGKDVMGVWYTDQEGHIQHALSLKSIMQQQLGFALPVQTLIGWMKGLPSSAVAVVQLNHFNQALSIAENGWQLRYAKYALYQQMALPGEIMIKGHGEKIKMVIRKWQIGPIMGKNKKSG